MTSFHTVAWRDIINMQSKLRTTCYNGRFIRLLETDINDPYLRAVYSGEMI